MVTFTSIELDKDGNPFTTTMREIKQLDIEKCPHFIFVADHYRGDGLPCRCDDIDHQEMAEWGYEWRDGQWRSPA